MSNCVNENNNSVALCEDSITSVLKRKNINTGRTKKTWSRISSQLITRSSWLKMCRSNYALTPLERRTSPSRENYEKGMKSLKFVAYNLQLINEQQITREPKDII